LNLDEYSTFDIETKLEKINAGNAESTIRYNSAVLIPFLRKDNHWHLFFIHRSTFVNSHKNQVSFPGGNIEQGDRNAVDTSLRETSEEIGIDRSLIKILGILPSFSPRKDYRITPVVGEIPWPTKIVLSLDEVDHYFTIPLNWLAEKSNFELKPYPLMDGTIGKVYFFHPYKGELLWGISAKFVVDLILLLKQKAAD
jgi:8-oxo-dGTP pyrophosphatase MutT (NUDIX family)